MKTCEKNTSILLTDEIKIKKIGFMIVIICLRSHIENGFPLLATGSITFPSVKTATIRSVPSSKIRP